MRFEENILLNYIDVVNKYSEQHSNNNREWHYIMSNINHNKSLLYKLNEKELLSNVVNICDAGIGFGTALFDLYLQSKTINKKFNFYGVEKNKYYVDFFQKNLINFWENNLKLIVGDLTIQNFSNYDIVYSFLPFKETNLLNNFYKRVCNDLKPGSIIIENSSGGKNSALLEFQNLETIDLGDIYVFRKV